MQFRKKRVEWVKGIHIALAATCGILFTNILLTVIASAVAYSKFDNQNAESAIIYRGSCVVTKYTIIGTHLFINVLSTISLAASNYCMQCLNAPSREEIDIAHSQRTWLDIGSTSLRNLWFAPLKRKYLWLVLLAASLPFHNMFVPHVLRSEPAI